MYLFHTLLLESVKSVNESKQYDALGNTNLRAEMNKIGLLLLASPNGNTKLVYGEIAISSHLIIHHK
jgi:hypothetical protein